MGSVHLLAKTAPTQVDSAPCCWALWMPKTEPHREPRPKVRIRRPKRPSGLMALRHRQPRQALPLRNPLRGCHRPRRTPAHQERSARLQLHTSDQPHRRMQTKSKLITRQAKRPKPQAQRNETASCPARVNRKRASPNVAALTVSPSFLVQRPNMLCIGLNQFIIRKGAARMLRNKFCSRYSRSTGSTSTATLTSFDTFRERKYGNSGAEMSWSAEHFTTMCQR